MSFLQKTSLFVLLLLGSWHIPLFRELWDKLDNAVFVALNPLAASFPSLLWFTNTRLFDIISDGVILFFLSRYVGRKDEKRRTYKVAQCVYLTLVTASCIFFVNKLLCVKVLGIQRISPSALLTDVFRLSLVFPGVKDASGSSFPGDHATTAFFFWVGFWVLTRSWERWLAGFYAIIMILPRLIIGAHWFTDVLMGSACIALSGIALAFDTPLCLYFVSKIEVAVQGAVTLYERLAKRVRRAHRS